MELAMLGLQAVFLVALATVAEGITEWLFAPWLGLLAKRLPAEVAHEPPKWVAALFGILLAIGYNADVLRVVFDYQCAWPPGGVLLTGVLLGRGANYLHDFIRRFLPDAAQRERNVALYL